MKYIKKPVVIEAIQYNNINREEIEEFVGAKLKQGIYNNTVCKVGLGSPIFNLTIQTLAGDMTALPGDFIIKNTIGECYPCKKEVFNMTYIKSSDVGEISDGYHTFNELYRYRMVYNAAFFNELAKSGNIELCKSKRHSDGEKCFGSDDWFIVMANLPTGQISNHYETKYWDLFNIPERKTAFEYDGHTPSEAADRIEKYLDISKNGESSKSDTMNFGDTIEALKRGRAVRRKGWNGKNLFVFKLEPLHIDPAIVAKMRTIPHLVKNVIAKGDRHIDYENRCIIYNKNTGQADSWAPSISDMFAEDWEVVD